MSETALDGASHSPLVICGDGGAEHARRLGIPCHVIVGDLDSITPDTRRYYEEGGTQIVHIPDQEHNDFEKAIEYLAGNGHRAAKWNGNVRVLGMTGGRVDHTFSNFSVMLRFSERFSSLLAIDADAEYRILTAARNHCSIHCPLGTTISLIPFGEAHGIVTEHLRYPLTHESLILGKREGLSNIVTGSPVTITIASGALLVAVSRGLD
ncbi:MAG TPA: thiamine diphosphokinase [Candidatus Kapabacteria bacterium]|nr:thiamine diphosphokinase [Candidatus Kapabacteria bacterium]